MDNSKMPAAPFVNYHSSSYEDCDNSYGFSKLELASLMIAQGMVTARAQHGQAYYSPDVLAIDSVKYAKAVLEEANK